jgi:hypothetical protein
MSDVLTIDQFKTIRLAGGGHINRSGGELCTMEAVAWLAGEPHSDKPICACPVIGAFIRTWQDKLPDDLREELCRDMVPQLVNSRVGEDATDRRAVLVADWCQRVVLPLWCDLVPSLAPDASALRALPEACTVEQLAQPSRVAIVDLAKQNAAAARAASWNASLAASLAASWDAARDASRAASLAASWDAARDASRAASLAASWAASWDAARAASLAASRDASLAASRDASLAASRAASLAASLAASRAASLAASLAASWDAARDAAWAASLAASLAASWDASLAASWDAVNPTKVAIWRTVPAMITRLLQEGDGNG